MICGQCREREAVVFIRRSGGGSSGDSALCGACARGRGISAGAGLLELSLDDLLNVGAEAGNQQQRSLSCPSCGLKLSELRREGRLGCSACADAFRPELSRVVVPGRESGPERRLAEALAAEDYESAAILRDGLGGLPAPRPASGGRPGFPLDPASLVDDSAPEADVVLWTSARACRDVEGVPFPGASAEASEGPIPVEAFKASEGWLVRTMSELGPCGRRSLAERGLAPRDFAAVDGAVAAMLPERSAYALLDSVDHLRAACLIPGLEPRRALETVLRIAEEIGRGAAFASRPGIGWICAMVADCGRGYSLSAAVHLPALAATGLVDRLFKALMAEGAAIRGLYSSAEGSAGSLYEISVEAGARVEDPVAALASAAGAAASAERRARAQLAERNRDSLLDAEGRAFGVLRNCRLLGADEAASLVSALRLAALRGSLRGVAPAALAALLAALGPGSLALAAGMGAPPSAEEQDSLRAAVVKAAIKDADYRPEEES